MLKRLMWQATLAGVSALVAIVANRAAATLWRRLFDEDPPE